MPLPVYVHGPPVTMQTWLATCTLSPALRATLRALAMSGFALSVAF
jgi:hypothetical protein